MSDSASTTDATHSTTTETTRWERLADADPIAVRDPLAELLGMVPEGEPLVVSFADVATAAGHACPAVAGAYRSTQLALDGLYPESTPVRSDISVVVGGERDDHGIGPMANAIRHVTGAADDTGFAGLAGCGGRQNLMSFEAVPGPGRTFEFTREDTDETVRVSFDPSAAGVDPDDGGGSPVQAAASIARGEASAAERERFHEQWHGRVQGILDAEPGAASPFTVARIDDS